MGTGFLRTHPEFNGFCMSLRRSSVGLPGGFGGNTGLQAKAGIVVVWRETHFLPPLVLPGRVTAPVKNSTGKVIIFLENARDFHKIITSTGAKFWWRFCPSLE